MRFALLPALLVGVPLTVGATSSSTPVAPSPTCVADDLLRLLRANGHEARPFCRTYLGFESTSIVATVTPPAVTVIATETLTSTHLATVTVTDVETTMTTVVETVVVETRTITSTSAAVVTTLAPLKRKLRRDALSAIGDYPAASISSACSCLNIAICVKTGTATAAAPTETSVGGTVTIDTTETATTTALATTTVVTTVTSSATATSVVVATPSESPGFIIPMEPFRLVLRSSAGEEWYLKRTYFPAGDLLYTTKDAAEADILMLDDQGRLMYYSVAYNDQVYAYFTNDWFTNDRLSGATDYPFLFTTLTTIRMASHTPYQFSADYDTGILTAANMPALLRIHTCPWAGGPRDVLFIVAGRMVEDPTCTVISSMSMEWI